MSYMSVAAACVRGVCVCLLPREDNNFKPLALRGKPLALVSTFLIAIKIATAGLIALTPATADLSTITVNRIVQLTNEERKQEGLNELSISSKLAQAAKLKGEDMLANDYFAHISPSGVTPWFWMAKTGYAYEVAGENLAIDFTEAEDVVAAWMASPSHHDNMLRADYLETGVAVVSGEFQGGTSIVVVHMFGKPQSGKVAAQNTAPAPTPTPSPKAATKPTSTPSPSPTPSPVVTTPTPTPPVPAPRIPRISSGDTDGIVQDTVQLFVEGDAASSAHILVNNRVTAAATLSENGKAIIGLHLDGFEDGNITVRAYASDILGQESGLSEPLSLTKDTTAPQIARDQLTFLVSPDTAASQVAVHAPSDAHLRVAVSQDTSSLKPNAQGWVYLPFTFDPITISFSDIVGNTNLFSNIDLVPHFSDTPAAGRAEFPATFSAWGRSVTAGLLVTILCMLLLAIFVRIRIQHPALITHASFVILLAAVLLVL